MTGIGSSHMQEEIRKLLPILRQWDYEAPVLIGEGAFARVYRVREIHTNSFCACKISKEKEMLRKEGELLKQLSHPLFPRYMQLRESAELNFLFMEYIPGQNLRQLIDKRGWMAERQIIRITAGLAEGLCYLHERSTPILFRDVKPENIVIREDGEVKLLDFGSACYIDSVGGTITGTQGYAAPEQWEKRGKVGLYSDVYALGQVMIYMMGERQTLRAYREIVQLAKACSEEQIEERIPNMRMVLHKLRFFERESRQLLRNRNAKVAAGNKKKNEYIFLKNILRY